MNFRLITSPKYENYQRYSTFNLQTPFWTSSLSFLQFIKFSRLPSILKRLITRRNCFTSVVIVVQSSVYTPHPTKKLGQLTALMHLFRYGWQPYYRFSVILLMNSEEFHSHLQNLQLYIVEKNISEGIFMIYEFCLLHVCNIQTIW